MSLARKFIDFARSIRANSTLQMHLKREHFSASNGEWLIDKPSPGPGQEMRGHAAGLAMFLPGDVRGPGRFGNQHQAVPMGYHPDFMALHLVVAPAFVFLTRGSEPLLEL